MAAAPGAAAAAATGAAEEQQPGDDQRQDASAQAAAAPPAPPAYAADVLQRLLQQLGGARPALRACVDSLPRVTVPHAAEGEAPPDGSSPTPFCMAGEPCTVCHEEFEAGAEVVALPCHATHVFHEACLLPWLEMHNTCPVCRHELEADASGGAPPGGAGAAAASPAALQELLDIMLQQLLSLSVADNQQRAGQQQQQQQQAGQEQQQQEQQEQQQTGRPDTQAVPAFLSRNLSVLHAAIDAAEATALSRGLDASTRPEAAAAVQPQQQQAESPAAAAGRAPDAAPPPLHVLRGRASQQLRTYAAVDSALRQFRVVQAGIASTRDSLQRVDDGLAQLRSALAATSAAPGLAAAQQHAAGGGPDPQAAAAVESLAAQAEALAADRASLAASYQALLAERDSAMQRLQALIAPAAPTGADSAQQAPDGGPAAAGVGSDAPGGSSSSSGDGSRLSVLRRQLLAHSSEGSGAVEQQAAAGHNLISRPGGSSPQRARLSSSTSGLPSLTPLGRPSAHRPPTPDRRRSRSEAGSPVATPSVLSASPPALMASMGHTTSSSSSGSMPWQRPSPTAVLFTPTVQGAAADAGSAGGGTTSASASLQLPPMVRTSPLRRVSVEGAASSTPSGLLGGSSPISGAGARPPGYFSPSFYSSNSRRSSLDRAGSGGGAGSQPGSAPGSPHPPTQPPSAFRAVFPPRGFSLPPAAIPVSAAAGGGAPGAAAAAAAALLARQPGQQPGGAVDATAAASHATPAASTTSRPAAATRMTRLQGDLAALMAQADTVLGGAEHPALQLPEARRHHIEALTAAITATTATLRAHSAAAAATGLVLERERQLVAAETLLLEGQANLLRQREAQLLQQARSLREAAAAAGEHIPNYSPPPRLARQRADDEPQQQQQQQLPPEQQQPEVVPAQPVEGGGQPLGESPSIAAASYEGARE